MARYKIINKISRLIAILIVGIAIGVNYSEEINSTVSHSLKDLKHFARLGEQLQGVGNTYSQDEDYSSVINAAQIKLCFTPPSNCAHLIKKVIDQAQNSIYMQAYGLTHRDIIDALIWAKQRGVEVNILLDRSNLTQKHSKIEELERAGINVSIDKVAGIAHNKVVIVDNQITITGSFNFTASAAKRNAENVVIIRNADIAHRYLQNWLARKAINQSKYYQQ